MEAASSINLGSREREMLMEILTREWRDMVQIPRQDALRPRFGREQIKSEVPLSAGHQESTLQHRMKSLMIPRRTCRESAGGRFGMAASQVVLYFDKQEDALLFTLAASSVIAADNSVRSNQSALKVAEEISKASRITTEGSLNRQAGTPGIPDSPHVRCV
jgi:hypothetical protein